ncbi:MAG: universal stress protein, partial [Gemmatimonadaceae bacterium]
AARWATSHVAPRANVIVAHVAPSPSPEAEEDERDERALVTTERAPTIAGGLRGFAETLDAPSVRSILRFGSPSHWLSALSNDCEASLLVLGRRAHANRTRVGEPNVIERAARRSNASVLVVPEGTSSPPGHVLAAVDDSAFAPVVLRIARGLARMHAIPLTVLHVLAPTTGAYERVIRTAKHMIAGPHKVRAMALPTLPFALPERTARWLSDLRRSESGADCEPIDVALGDPAREIALAATTRREPIIVLGARGADLAPWGSLGSVARELLTRAPVPVLAVQGG